jgi:two-component system chemotaxis response regulator CheY
MMPLARLSGSLSTATQVIAAKKAGVSNYIVKPFNAATLKTKIEAVFGSAA